MIRCKIYLCTSSIRFYLLYNVVHMYSYSGVQCTLQYSTWCNVYCGVALYRGTKVPLAQPRVVRTFRRPGNDFIGHAKKSTTTQLTEAGEQTIHETNATATLDHRHESASALSDCSHHCIGQQYAELHFELSKWWYLQIGSPRFWLCR
jgi:hypothetical protein